MKQLYSVSIGELTRLLGKFLWAHFAYSIKKKKEKRKEELFEIEINKVPGVFNYLGSEMIPKTLIYLLI